MPRCRLSKLLWRSQSETRLDVRQQPGSASPALFVSRGVADPGWLRGMDRGAMDGQQARFRGRPRDPARFLADKNNEAEASSRLRGPRDVSVMRGFRTGLELHFPDVKPWRAGKFREAFYFLGTLGLADQCSGG